MAQRHVSSARNKPASIRASPCIVLIGFDLHQNRRQNSFGYERKMKSALDTYQSQAQELAAAGARLNDASLFAGQAPMSIAFLTDDDRIGDPSTIISALPPGTGVIYRDYNAPSRAQMAGRLTDLCIERKLLFYVAGDPDLAERVGAHGIHLSAKDAQKPPAKNSDLLLSVACHNEEEIQQAEDIGANSIFLSPVFPTRSHPGAGALGVDRFKQLAALSSIPVLALGGVTAKNAAELKAPSVAGFGAIGAFA